MSIGMSIQNDGEQIPQAATSSELAETLYTLDSHLRRLDIEAVGAGVDDERSRLIRILRRFIEMLLQSVVPNIGSNDRGELRRILVDVKQLVSILDIGISRGELDFASFVEYSQELVDKLRSYAHALPGELFPHEQLEELVVAFRYASSKLMERRRENDWSDREARVNRMFKEIRDLNHQVSNALSEITRVGIEIENKNADSDSLRKQARIDSRNASAALEKAETVSGQLQEALTNAKVLNTGAATNELTRNFAAYRRSHAQSYKSFMQFSIIGFIVSVGLATLLSVPGWLAGAEGVSTWPATIWRIALVSGLLGVSTFLAKQAVHHRAQAQWADSIQVQLKTFKAYTDLLPESAQRDLLRAEFARRVFGPEPAATGRDANAGNADDVSIGAIQEALELLKSMKSITGEGKRAGSGGATDS